MARIILSVIFLVALVLLIVFNAGASAPVNLFGWQIDDLPISVIGLVCFISGIIYSFFFYLMAYLERGRRERLAKRKKKLRDQEAELKSREHEVDERAEESQRRLEAARGLESGSSDDSEGRGGFFAGLFGGKKTTPKPSQDKDT